MAAMTTDVSVSLGVGLCLQFLRERAAAARRLADKAGPEDSLLQDRARQLDVIIGEIEAGFHLPAVAERSAAEPENSPVAERSEAGPVDSAETEPVR